MHVYIVIRSSAHGDTIDKVFTSSPKAAAYVEEQTKAHAVFDYRIETYWAM